jgi:hypothetical protein
LFSDFEQAFLRLRTWNVELPSLHASHAELLLDRLEELVDVAGDEAATLDWANWCHDWVAHLTPRPKAGRRRASTMSPGRLALEMSIDLVELGLPMHRARRIAARCATSSGWEITEESIRAAQKATGLSKREKIDRLRELRERKWTSKGWSAPTLKIKVRRSRDDFDRIRTEAAGLGVHPADVNGYRVVEEIVRSEISVDEVDWEAVRWTSADAALARRAAIRGVPWEALANKDRSGGENVDDLSIVTCARIPKHVVAHGEGGNRNQTQSPSHRCSKADAPRRRR